VEQIHRALSLAKSSITDSEERFTRLGPERPGRKGGSETGTKLCRRLDPRARKPNALRSRPIRPCLRLWSERAYRRARWQSLH